MLKTIYLFIIAMSLSIGTLAKANDFTEKQFEIRDKKVSINGLIRQVEAQSNWKIIVSVSDGKRKKFPVISRMSLRDVIRSIKHYYEKEYQLVLDDNIDGIRLYFTLAEKQPFVQGEDDVKAKPVVPAQTKKPIILPDLSSTPDVKTKDKTPAVKKSTKGHEKNILNIVFDMKEGSYGFEQIMERIKQHPDINLDLQVHQVEHIQLNLKNKGYRLSDLLNIIKNISQHKSKYAIEISVKDKLIKIQQKKAMELQAPKVELKLSKDRSIHVMLQDLVIAKIKFDESLKMQQMSVLKGVKSKQSNHSKASPDTLGGMWSNILHQQNHWLSMKADGAAIKIPVDGLIYLNDVILVSKADLLHLKKQETIDDSFKDHRTKQKKVDLKPFLNQTKPIKTFTDLWKALTHGDKQIELEFDYYQRLFQDLKAFYHANYRIEIKVHQNKGLNTFYLYQTGHSKPRGRMQLIIDDAFLKD